MEEQYSLLLMRVSQLRQVYRCLNYCVDTEFWESSVDCGFIDGPCSHSKLHDLTFRRYLNSAPEESKLTLTLSALIEMIAWAADNIKHCEAESWMQGRFISYFSILRLNGLKWIIEKNAKLVVQHVLSAVRPHTLQNRSENDLELCCYDLRKNYRVSCRTLLGCRKLFSGSILVKCKTSCLYKWSKEQKTRQEIN